MTSHDYRYGTGRHGQRQRASYRDSASAATGACSAWIHVRRAIHQRSEGRILRLRQGRHPQPTPAMPSRRRLSSCAPIRKSKSSSKAIATSAARRNTTWRWETARASCQGVPGFAWACPRTGCRRSATARNGHSAATTTSMLAAESPGTLCNGEVADGQVTGRTPANNDPSTEAKGTR